MVFILLAKYRPRDSSILPLASKQGAIVTESIITCKLSDLKFNSQSNGNADILIQLLLLMLFEILCTNFFIEVLFSSNDYPSSF